LANLFPSEINQTALYDSGAVKFFLKYLDTANSTTKIRITYMLCNFIVLEKYQEALINLQVVQYLVNLLSLNDNAILEQVAWTFENLTTNEKRYKDLVDANLIPPLITLLHNGTIEEQLQLRILKILTNLALNEQAKDRIRMADGIPILLSILSESSNTLKEQTAWAIANLANSSATNADVLRIGGAIKKLVALLSYSDEIKFRALWALYCLSLHEKNLNTFRDEMAIAPIAKLLTSTNKHFVELSSKIISQIAVIEENKKSNNQSRFCRYTYCITQFTCSCTN